MSTRWMAAVGLALPALAVVPLAAGPTGRIQDSATGLGTIHFGDDGASRGFFDFDVEGGGAGPQGRFVFAAEEQHSYPEIVIRVTEITEVVVSNRTVLIRAEGHLQQHPVRIVATAIDNVGLPIADRFTITTVPIEGDEDDGGEGAFHASGDLHTGDIHVGVLQ